MLLADWGAEVIRVESRYHFPLATRGVQAHPSKVYVDSIVGTHTAYVKSRPDAPRWNQYCLFNAHARNKLSCTMDLTRPEGLANFKKLIAKSDVFVESNAPHVIEQFQITYDVLKEVNPRLIMLSLPGFGQAGPYKYYRVLGADQESFVGHTYIRGYQDMDLEANVTVYHTDEAAGVHAAFAALTALYYRNRTGKGQYIDMAQSEATIPELGEAVMDYVMNGRVHERGGNRDIHSAVQGCYLCRGTEQGGTFPLGYGKWVNISIFNDAEWAGLCRVMGRPELVNDERFSGQLARLQNHDEVDRIIGEWTRQHDHYAIMFMLQDEGVPAAPVADEADAYNDIHMKDRGFFERLTQVDCGTHLYPGLPWRMSKTPNHPRLPPVRFGEHNEYVHKKVIGVSDEEYAEMEKTGHIGMDYDKSIP
jgi:crotonobetainyl-CoA:carnitine CoA-transferase CaiB-like acyl-CoA transferase